jgi:DNA-binding response OmpR family regulator
VTRPPDAHSFVLVEDDSLVAEGVAALLESDGFAVSVATTGAAALGVIERARPDAVILDVDLPDMDGVEVYTRIANRWPTLPVVFASGHADVSRVSTYLSRPTVAYLMKPYKLAELYRVLDALLRAEPADASIVTEPLASSRKQSR